MTELPMLFEKLGMSLLAELSKHPREGAGQAVYVTSPGFGEGKTTVAVALALTMAKRSAMRCLLVDANMEKPAATQQLLGSSGKTGLADAVRSRGELRVEPLKTALPNLWLLPAGSDIQPALLFQRDVVDRILASLLAGYDIVVFDGAGLSSSGANALAHSCDHLVYVLDSTATRREIAEKALDGLGINSAKLAAVVLNKKIQYIPNFLYDRF